MPYRDDTRMPTTGTPGLYSAPALLAADQKISQDTGVPLNQLSPELISQYQQEEAARGGGTWEQVFMNKILPVAAVSLATMGVGSGAAAALAPSLGATGGAIAGGVAQGALAGAGGATLTGQNIGRGALVGGLTGGVTGGLSQIASPVTNGMVSSGINPTLANSITRGAIGAGVGAIGSALTGGRPSNGALVGGVGGAAAGAAGSLSGSPYVGNAAGTIAGSLAGKYLTSAPKPSTPASGTAMSQGVPGMPVGSPSTPMSVTPGVSSPTTGLGYAPRQPTNYSGIDFSKYGQGPEASFYTSGSDPSPHPTPNLGTYSGFTAPPLPVMRSATQGITPQNST
jgi:hypothetical protein